MVGDRRPHDLGLGAVFLYGVADSGTMVRHHLLATHALGKPILSGGLTGPEGSIFVLFIFALIAALIIFTPGATGAAEGDGLADCYEAIGG
jgi:uncharacterized membrane protein YbhN (UPF0104 family)